MTTTLRKGDTGPAVFSLQRTLDALALECGPTDGIFGNKTEAAVYRLQEYRCIGTDGVVGPQTEAKLIECTEDGWQAGQLWELRPGVMVFGWRHPKVGLLPQRRGKVSKFGGPTDLGDRRYGQALIGASTIVQLRARYADLIELGVFRTDLPDELPAGMGISWALANKNGLYCAMLWNGDARPNARIRRVLAVTPDKAIAGVPTDLGPATWTGRVWDGSDYWLEQLSLVTDDSAEFYWGPDNSYGLVSEC